MKKQILLIVAFALASFTVVKAQTSNHRFGWSHLFSLNSYEGKTLGTENWSFSNGSFEYATGLKYYLNPRLNLGADLGFGNIDFLQYDKSFTEGWVSMELKLLNETAFIQPYLTGGLGFTTQSPQFSDVNDKKISKTQFPLGFGFRVPLNDRFSAQVQSTYHVVTDKDILNYDYWQAGLGLTYNFGPAKNRDIDGDGISNKEDGCPEKPGPYSNNGCPLPPDTDKDGIADESDACPNVAGLTQFNGCPDTDGDGIINSKDDCPDVAGSIDKGGCPDTDNDGIIDSKDSCPKVPGIAALNGCPDSDGDGIADAKDSCPTAAGTAANSGCPDSDNDGIIDLNDACPTTPGISSNRGCPEIDQETQTVLKQALEGVQFESGRDVIKIKSYVKLNSVVAIMRKHPEYNLNISGYTDSSGNDDANLRLSNQRAQAVKKYLEDKGIETDRMTATGYGEATPVADNATAAGRAKNRRVEFEIIF